MKFYREDMVRIKNNFVRSRYRKKFSVVVNVNNSFIQLINGLKVQPEDLTLIHRNYAIEEGII